MFRALRHRNFRLFFTGQGISLVGTWMTRVAMGWLVYRLTDSELLLGVVAFAGQIPVFVLSPLAGVLADRWNLQRVLVLTQALGMAQSLALAALTLGGVVQVWHVILLALAQGAINAFDTPARQAFVVQMVEDRAELGNAIALNSSLFNGARLVGPSLAGLIIAAAGEGVCFLIDGLSYVAVIAALLAMRIAAMRDVRPRPPVLEGLVEGVRHALGFAPMRAILLLVALASFMGLPYMVLMPVFARDVLGGGSHSFGFLMGASGCGALAGALVLASRRSVHGLERVIVAMSALFGVALCGFALSRVLWVSMPMVFVTGFAMLLHMASSNTLLQTIVDDDKRGRVMSLYTMAVLGMAPLGSLYAGWLASHIGAPATLVIGGGFCLGGSLLFARTLPRWRAAVRPVYQRKGVIP